MARAFSYASATVVATSLGRVGSPGRRAELLEELAVLGALDRVEAGAEDFAPALPQHPLFGELHGEVEPRLAAEGRRSASGRSLRMMRATNSSVSGSM